MQKYIYQIKDFPLDNDSLLLHETLFHNANGYLGARSNFEEGYPEGYHSIQGQYINGFYDFSTMPQAEKLYGLFEEKQTMLNAVDTQGIELRIDGERFSMFEGKVLERIRTLDMQNGVTIREVLWESPGGKRVLVKVRRMASFNILPLFLVEYTVTALNFSGEAELISSHIGEVMNYFNPDDPRVAGEADKYLLPERDILEGSNSFMLMHTSKSNLRMCSAVRNTLDKATKEKQIKQKGFHTEQILTVECRQGESITLYKETVLCDSVRYSDPVKAAQETLDRIKKTGFTALYQKQRDYLDKFWNECDMEVYGDPELNIAVRYNLYQLMQSVGKDRYSNIAAKGLSGEGYEGHYFWDTEMYMQPFFTLTAREVSKNLIRYRYTILEYAKENARIMGHNKGALYPWRTIMGRECSGYYVSGSAAYHINGDVAYAVISYYLAAGDLELMQECGAEILIETARLWMDTGNYYKGRFHIHEVTGPDEYTCLVNNNYYTNAVAKYNLRWAAKIIDLLAADGMADEVVQKLQITQEELDTFKAAAEAMYLPYDQELGINPQDDSFLEKKIWDVNTIPEDKKPLLLHYHPMHLYRHQICKQADTVMAHFILEDEQDLETMRRSFEYYERVTTHDSSLSPCIFSIMASKLGKSEAAYAYFGESAKLDLFNTHKNTRDGIHTANMGGTYMAIVYGFGGLRIKADGLYLMPALPDQWEGYQFRIRYRDAGIRVSIRPEHCELELLEGDDAVVHVYGKAYELKTEKIIIRRGEQR